MSQKVSKVDYSKGLIYKLCCKDTTIEEIYIGSTTNFKIRKNKHKYDCCNINSKNYNFKVYKFIRETGGFENWDMILIQYFSCNTKKELESKERELIELYNPILNCEIPGRLQTEYRKVNKDKIKEKHKEYYKNNKDKISQRDKEYRKVNKDKIKEKHKEYYENNKDKIKLYYENNKTEITEKRKIKTECEYCKSVVRKLDLNRHQKSNKCLKFQLNE